MATNPMHQFNVYKIGPEIKIGEIDISFTNASLFMVLSSLAILILFNFGTKKNSLIPNKIQLIAKLNDEIEDHKDMVLSLMDSIVDKTTILKKNKELDKYRSQIDKNLKKLNKDKKFFEDNENCPTCEQDIDSGFKKRKLIDVEDDIDEMNEGLDKLVLEVERVEERIGEIQTSNDMIQKNYLVDQFYGFELQEGDSLISHYHMPGEGNLRGFVGEGERGAEALAAFSSEASISRSIKKLNFNIEFAAFVDGGMFWDRFNTNTEKIETKFNSRTLADGGVGLRLKTDI